VEELLDALPLTDPDAEEPTVKVVAVLVHE
jgi:hypothetical protein